MMMKCVNIDDRQKQLLLLVSGFPKILDKLLYKVTAVENFMKYWSTDVTTQKEQIVKKVESGKEATDTRD